MNNTNIFGFCLNSPFFWIHSRLSHSLEIKLYGIVIAGQFPSQMLFLSPNQWPQSTEMCENKY